MTVQEVKLLRC